MKLWYYEGPMNFGPTEIKEDWKTNIDYFAPWSLGSIFFLTEDMLNDYIAIEEKKLRMPVRNIKLENPLSPSIIVGRKSGE